MMSQINYKNKHSLQSGIKNMEDLAKGPRGTPNGNLSQTIVVCKDDDMGQHSFSISCAHL